MVCWLMHMIDICSSLRSWWTSRWRCITRRWSLRHFPTHLQELAFDRRRSESCMVCSFPGACHRAWDLIMTWKFSQDPFKLVVLAKDIRSVGVAHADFSFSEDIMSIVTGNDEGVIRIYEYIPDGKLKIPLVIFLPHYCLQILSPKMGNNCCAAPNSMVKARASRLSSSLVVLKKNLSFHKLSAYMRYATFR